MGGEDWYQRAACSGTGRGLFFSMGTEAVAKARETCRGCPVREECLQYATDENLSYGMWGGYTERERYFMSLGISIEEEVAVCKGCSKPYQPSNANQRFHSRECYRNFYRKKK